MKNVSSLIYFGLGHALRKEACRVSTVRKLTSAETNEFDFPVSNRLQTSLGYALTQVQILW